MTNLSSSLRGPKSRSVEWVRIASSKSLIGKGIDVGLSTYPKTRTFLMPGQAGRVPAMIGTNSPSTINETIRELL